MDFFESLAFLIKKGVLDLDMVRWYFGYWIVRYGHLSKEYVVDFRKLTNEPTLWADYEKLYFSISKRMTSGQGERYKQFIISKEEINRFLLEEGETEE